MPKLFGLNIDKLVASSVAAAGGVLSATLTKATPGTRSSTDPAAGTNPTTTDYACRGFVDDRTVRGTEAQAGGRVVSILGATLPDGVRPAPNDLATIEGTSYVVISVKSDPAGAVYELTVEV